MPGMKRFSKLLKGGTTASSKSDASASDAPETTAARGVRLFCESASPTNAGEEVLHLPVIVEAAESSPIAAAAAAQQIRKFLARENYTRPHVQYNAVMLIRILADNPGASFTKNVDDKFVEAVKWLLRHSRDPSVQQILRETLSSFEEEKAYDETLALLLHMWKKEKAARGAPQQQPAQRQMQPPNQMNTFAGFQGGPQTTFNTYNASQWAAQPAPPRPENPPRTYSNTSQLPSPLELASRIEEAHTSANLLMQLTFSTPPAEILSNDLLQEFSERCQSAQRNLEGYINCTNPAPDEDTFQTLIETCEQLSLASSKYQRAVLAGRREIGAVAVAGTGGSPVYPAQLRAPSLGKPYVGPSLPALSVPSRSPPSAPLISSPPKPSMNSPSGRALPIPPSSMRQQLQMRPENGGPAPAQLYPSPPAASVANPFDDGNHELAGHPPPVELEASYSPPPTIQPPQLPSNSGYNPALARRPPIPTAMPPEFPQPYSPKQIPRKALDPIVPPQSIPRWGSSDNAEEDGLYDEPASATSAAPSSIYPSPVSNQSTSDPWSAQRQHWANVTASTSNPQPQPELADFRNPHTAASQPKPHLAYPTQAPPPPTYASSPIQAHLQPPLPQSRPATTHATPSYIHRQDVSTHTLTMSGGASAPVTRQNLAMNEGRDEDYLTTRPLLPHTWGEESFVHGNGGIRDV